MESCDTCKKCVDILVKNEILPTNVYSYILTVSERREISKNWKNWAIKNHPDKGGEQDIFKLVSNCYDIIAKENKCVGCGFGSDISVPVEKRGYFNINLDTIAKTVNIFDPYALFVPDGTFKEVGVDISNDISDNKKDSEIIERYKDDLLIISGENAASKKYYIKKIDNIKN